MTEKPINKQITIPNKQSIQSSALPEIKPEFQSKISSKFQDEYEYTETEAEKTCDIKSIQCCGTLCGCLRAWIPCIFCCIPYPYIKISQYETGLLSKFGQFKSLLPPGLHKINPFTEKVEKISKKTQILTTSNQTILTKDNLTLQIAAVVYYRVINPKKVAYRIKNIKKSIIEITTATLRTICGENILQDILEKRQQISQNITDYIYEQSKDWGILIEQVFIKDMVLNNDLQSTMASTTKMKRLGQSKIISAKSDVQSAILFREAADSLDTPAAIQIRYLETVQNLAKNNNPKITFIDLKNNDSFTKIKIDSKNQNLTQEKTQIQGLGQELQEKKYHKVVVLEQEQDRKTNGSLDQLDEKQPLIENIS